MAKRITLTPDRCEALKMAVKQLRDGAWIFRRNQLWGNAERAIFSAMQIEAMLEQAGEQEAHNGKG